MARPHALIGFANQWKQCRRLDLQAFRTCRVLRNTHLSRKFCRTSVNNLDRHWVPYTVDVGVMYHKYVRNWLRGKLQQISTPVGMSSPKLKPGYLEVPAVFRTVCVDTAAELPEEVRHKMPTILCVHGSGGSHEEFIPLLKNLVDEHGFRAVCLNWPGFGKTRGWARRDDALFQFRSEDTVNFLVSFLREINLNRVDMVIGHSIGCVAASYVCARGTKPASMVLIAPVPSQPFKGIEPHALLKAISRLWRWRILRPFVQYFVQIGYMRRGFTSKDTIHAVNATLMAAGINFELIERLAMELEMKKMPKLIVYGGKDNFIESNVQDQFAPKLGVKSEHFDVYNEQLDLVRKGTTAIDHYSKGILFEDGGHVPHLKESYIPILEKEILNLLENSQSKRS